MSLFDDNITNKFPIEELYEQCKSIVSEVVMSCIRCYLSDPDIIRKYIIEDLDAHKLMFLNECDINKICGVDVYMGIKYNVMTNTPVYTVKLSITSDEPEFFNVGKPFVTFIVGIRGVIGSFGWLTDEEYKELFINEQINKWGNEHQRKI